MLVHGTISNKQSGETLPGATVFVSDASGKMISPPRGANTDGNGYYSINANYDEYLTATFVGLNPRTSRIASTIIDFPLDINANAILKPIEIVAKPFNWKLLIAIAMITTGVIYFSVDFFKYKKII